MKYHVTSLPSSEKAIKFSVRGSEGKEESQFNFSRPLIEVWGNPKESKLKELMIAHIKSHGWAKKPVSLDPKNSPLNLNTFIASLPKAKK